MTDKLKFLPSAGKDLGKLDNSIKFKIKYQADLTNPPYVTTHVRWV